MCATVLAKRKELYAEEAETGRVKEEPIPPGSLSFTQAINALCEAKVSTKQLRVSH